jgi:transcriptional regulator with XRE-family HTH domain
MSGDERNYKDFLEGIDNVRRVQARREEHFLEGVSAVAGSTVEADAGMLGDRVRMIRERRNLTLADVASRTGLDEAFLTRIENNLVNPPLGTLVKLAKALDMKMGYFISGGDVKPYTVVRESERRRISRRAASEDTAYGYTYQALAPGKTDRHMEPFLVILEPSAEKKLSSHDGQEFIFVLEGRMEAILGNDQLVLGPGDSIYYDSNVPHLVRCVEGASTRILAVLYTQEK